MELRFFVPGNLCSNLDFVESIFGNGGDPFIAENDAALDPEHWSGTTGCVILAPHLMGTTKKELGLPPVSEATDRQKRDGMCWEKEDELYNDGGAFKMTCRDAAGRIVTVVSDSYFGYCKKEVKTQLGFSANLHGLAEEEHAGGTLAFTGYDLGEDFKLSEYFPEMDQTFDGVVARYIDSIDVKQDSGYAVDKSYPDIIYLPEDARIELNTKKSAGAKTARANAQAAPESNLRAALRLQSADGQAGRRAVAGASSATPRKAASATSPARSPAAASRKSPSRSPTRSFPGRSLSAISKRTSTSRRRSSTTSSAAASATLQRIAKGRPLLSKERSLGSVVKLLTPSTIDYTDEYNAWLESIPQHVRELVLIIKRFYKEDWGDDWRERFTVDLINGVPGNILRYRGQPMLTQYLRVGYTGDGSWRTFGLRKDFFPASKISLEDDITASVVAPTSQLGSVPPGWKQPSAKFVHNCEYRFFQRPDDAIVRGYDKQTEADLSSYGAFMSNYAPLGREFAKEETEDAIRFGQYTEPMQEMVFDFVNSDIARLLLHKCLPAHRRRVADEESALPASPSGFEEPA